MLAHGYRKATTIELDGNDIRYSVSYALATLWNHPLHMTRFAVTLFLVILAYSSSFAASAIEGSTTFQMSDGHIAPVHYKVQWGRFLKASRLKDPGFAKRLSTLTFVGEVEVFTSEKITCRFEIDGQRFFTTRDDSRSDLKSEVFVRSLTFTKECLNLSGYRISLELREERKREWFDDANSNLGWRAAPTRRQRFTAPRKMFWMGLEKLDRDQRWLLQGAVVADKF